jgi:putative oxidoreductase
LQRLFSTFANGWPGAGLLLQRVLTGMVLLVHGIVQISEKPQLAQAVPEIIGAGAGLLLLLGLWTPVVGILVAVVEVWIIFRVAGDPWIPIILAILGATLAMIGPGAWSIDARLFGRKRIETHEY